MSTGMLVDGVFGSEAIDSSGEILDVEGADISSLEKDGVFNFEHKGGGEDTGSSPNDILGRIVAAKKIFGPKDCSNDRERMYWKQVGLPFIYGVGRLFDGAGHPGAIAAAAQIRDAVANGEPPIMRFSVEGSTLEKKGNILKRSVIRRVALTLKPCNKSAASGVLADPNAPKGYDKNPGEVKRDEMDDIIDRLAQSEAGDPMYERLGGSSEHEYVPFSEDELAPVEKMLEAGSYNVAPSALTGGAALQVESLRRRKVEDLTKQVKAAFRDWNRLDPIKPFLKHRLPEASEEFINHFADLADDWKLKKDEHEAPAAANKKAAKKSPMKTALKQAKKPVTAAVLDEDESRPGPLTIHGKTIPENPNITSPVFDERTGVLHTPRGSFPMYIPSRDPNPGSRESFHNIMEDPKVNAFHNYATENWAKMNKLMKHGKLPPEAVMHAVLFSQLSPNCLDAETEALTQRGWVKGFDLKKTDFILTKNAATGKLEWQQPTDLRMFPDYEGPMVEFKNRSFYALTTPDHEWLVTTGMGHLRIKKSTEIAFDNDKIHRTGDYDGAEQSGLIPDEAELLGWFVTDGHYHKSVAYREGARKANSAKSKYEMAGIWACLTQSYRGNPKKCERIEALLTRLGGEATCRKNEGKLTYEWRLGPKLTKMLLARAPERYLTVSAIQDLSLTALLRLREAMVLGDGSVWAGKEGWSGKETLVTGRQEQADAFQALLTMTGTASSVVWRDMAKYEPKSDKMNNVPKMSGCYVVTALQRKYVRINEQHRTDIPKMKVGVWCPILPNLFFVARRKGHVFITKNTPVPVQELMYGHLVDHMKQTGVDARDPAFGTTKEGWTDRDSPDTFPKSSRSHFQKLQSQLRLKRDGVHTDRKAGDISSFMLANNKWKNMEQYHQLHDQLIELLGRHKDDARSAVEELMHHKNQSHLHEAKRARHLDAGKADIGPYTAGPVVAGLAPKTARYTLGMLGGGNIQVPDTHFARYLFGLEKGHASNPVDNKSIAYLKNLLWNENNSHVLNGVDRYYAQNHDAVKHMMEHPQFKHLFEGNPENAVFPAFWKNWVGIAPHERARGMQTYASNEVTDHRPFWETTAPFVDKALKTMKSEEGQDWTLPMQTAQQHAEWVEQYGELPALMLYFTHLVPQLLARYTGGEQGVPGESASNEDWYPDENAADFESPVDLSPTEGDERAYGIHPHVQPAELDFAKSEAAGLARPHPLAHPRHDGHTAFYSGLLKDDPSPAAHPHSSSLNEQAAGKGAATYKQFAAPYGTVNPGTKSNLFHYDYRSNLPGVDALVKKHGFQTYLAGGKYGKPDLAKRNYNTGHLMVYDPTPASGGDFGDEAYTKSWRTIHELAHALTYPQLNEKYGEGRRIGKLGVHRTPREAKRAVEWEWNAAHKQRELGEQLGIHVPDETFHKELNTVMHDALHRAVTGQFTEPSDEGFMPHSHKVPLEHALGVIDQHAKAMGLTHDNDTLKKPVAKAETESYGEPEAKHPAVSGGHYAIITAEKPRFPVSTHGENDTLERELKHRNMRFEKVLGSYGGQKENSYLVHSPSIRDVLDMGRRYGQEGVIYAKGPTAHLIYTHGPNAGHMHELPRVETFARPPEDNFTTVFNGGKNGEHLHFSWHGDWDHLHQAQPLIDAETPRPEPKLHEPTADEQLTLKFEYLMTELALNLRKAGNDEQLPVAADPVSFGDTRVRPGLAYVNAKSGKQHPYAVLQHTPDGGFVGVPQSMLGHHTPTDFHHAKPGTFTMHRRATSAPEPVLVNALTHGDWNVNRHPEQHSLIHGSDLSLSPLHKPVGAAKDSMHGAEAEWRRMGDGRIAFVKPQGGSLMGVSEAKREAVYHNVAKDFFGLGQYMPNVALFKHPVSGKEMAALERVHGDHIHTEMIPGAARGRRPKGEHADTINKFGTTGELDKLGMMNAIMGNNDRHSHNYLMTPNGMKLIDHGLSLAPDHDAVRESDEHYVPHYLSMYDNLHGVDGESEPVHTAAQDWLTKLNPQELHHQMMSHQLPKALADEARHRLVSMQTALRNKPLLGRSRVLRSPWDPNSADIQNKNDAQTLNERKK